MISISPRIRMLMIHLVSLSALLFVLSFRLSAQPPMRPVSCGNDWFHELLVKHYPVLLENINTTFEAAKNSNRSILNDPLSVEVVVHVVWNAAEENLDDSILYNQIDILNRDFNRLNPDSNLLRNYFKPVAGNANIHFHLASIVRVQTDQLFNVDILGTNLLPEVKHDASGGSDAWDPETYINIWVCKIQPIEIFGLPVGQILGFSFPPNNLPNWPPDVGAPNPDEDGLVIDYRVFGSNNPNTIEVPGTSVNLIVKGRTPVHEMGHYLGLRHIWGDGGLLGPNDCAQSDGIDDTPFANAQSDFDCDTTKNTCVLVEPFYTEDAPDLVENYMDYASEDCMIMFTKGQVELMRSVLYGPRVSLLGKGSGVKEILSKADLVAAPNPAQRRFDVRCLNCREGDVTVSLIGLDGRLVFKQNTFWLHREFPTSIDPGNIAPGLYILQVQDPGVLHTGKVLITQ